MFGFLIIFQDVQALLISTAAFLAQSLGVSHHDELCFLHAQLFIIFDLRFGQHFSDILAPLRLGRFDTCGLSVD